MVTESPLSMLSEMGVRPMIGGGGDGFSGEDLGMLLREQRRQEAASDRERELNIYRSGSAPPTVEGSLAAVGGLFGVGGGAPGFSGEKDVNGLMSEEDLRSDPAYLSYYYSHVNLNPRLPPPVLSKEDWRFAQRLHAGSSALGGIGDRRKQSRGEEGGSRSLFSMQPGFNQQKEESEADRRNVPGGGEWLDRGADGLIGLPGITLGRQKSFAEIFQDDVSLSAPISGHPSRPASRNALDNGIDLLSSTEALGLNHETIGGVHNISASTSQTFASVLTSSLSRSATPDPQLLARAPSPGLPPVGVRIGATDKKINSNSSSFNGVSSGLVESNDLVAALANMDLLAPGAIGEDNFQHSKLQHEISNHQNYLFGAQVGQRSIKEHQLPKKSESSGMSSNPRSGMSSYGSFSKDHGGLVDLSNSTLRPEGQVANSYLKTPASSVTSPGGSPVHYSDVDSSNMVFTSYGSSGYSINPALGPMMTNHIGTGNLPPLFENAVAASALGSPGMDSRLLGGFPSMPTLSGATDLQSLNRLGNHTSASALQMPLIDPLYLQYMRTAEYAAQVAANISDPAMANSYADLLGIQRAYAGGMLQPHKQYNAPFLGKSGGLNQGLYGNPAFGLGVSYPGSPLASSVLPGSPGGPGSPLRHGERSARFPSAMRNFNGGSWHLDANGNMVDGLASSLLEEFKSNKTKCFELSDIAGHVVEFSADQYGSRFIQQKLETATTDEKDMVFEEIMPQALSLMTDVFGNYVIQKFFEHGSPAQIRELADQLTSHVLTLSLQMYGCRVIQKAIEVVGLDQQTSMVQELDGQVMRCVRDQNGNHVIQKCIECIPQNAIQFIISSFYDQVVTLSTHPYGCRVIQRVLEHCDDPKTQQIVMDEIMQCVCMLAQDQYGNYVIQHVLEHGKPHERTAIIMKLAGQIVQMSQQKFASNVVEKCLTFGGPEERQILVNEMLGSTDENEPLQAMMKDQFANYVVQKVLETCDDQQRELILSRIKVHLNALKKYTYGKHIVARVEKLVAAGERRIGLQSTYTS